MKLDISSTTRWPNKMSCQEDGLTFSHVFWNQNLYNERYLSIQSIVGKKGKHPNISPFLSYTYLPKLTFVSFSPIFLLNLSILFQEIQFKLKFKYILEYRNVKSAKTNKLTFGHAWLLLCMDWGRRWQPIMELFLGPSQKDSDPTKGFPSKGPKVAVCHQERKIISQIECVVRRSANSQTRNKTISCSKIGQIFSFYQHRQDWMI